MPLEFGVFDHIEPVKYAKPGDYQAASAGKPGTGVAFPATGSCESRLGRQHLHRRIRPAPFPDLPEGKGLRGACSESVDLHFLTS